MQNRTIDDVIQPYQGRLPEWYLQEARSAFSQDGFSLSEVSEYLEDALDQSLGESAGFISDRPPYYPSSFAS